jgi:CHAT domain-containing protein
MKIGELYGSNSKVLTREKATENIWKNEAANYRYLHLATHGILDTKRPLYSHILLAPDASGEDGILEAWEIMQMNLQADIVTLSACETARGKISNGEGMIGLSWVFFVSGVPTTVVSQWKVESASTTDLMVEFHRQIRKEDKDNSYSNDLRQAMLSEMKKTNRRHPFYWSGFIAIGKQNAKF